MKIHRFWKKAAACVCAALLLMSSLTAFAKEPVVLPEKEGKITAQAEDSALFTDYEWAVLYLTNKMRMASDGQPLSTFSALQSAADVRENELPLNFDHTRPDGSSYSTALDEAGISRSSSGENIAGGYMGNIDPVTVMNLWLNSPGHRANIMSSLYTHMGVGYLENSYSTSGYTAFWVQLFTGGCTPDRIYVDGADLYYYFLPSDQPIDAAGLVLIAECDHGICYLPVTEEMCSGYDPSRVGEYQSVTVSCYGLQTTVDLVSYPPMTFPDVPEDAWFHDYVEYVYMLGIMQGKYNGTVFEPLSPVLRAEFTLMLHRLEGLPEVDIENTFPDVPNGDWYTDAVLWANDAGIVTGYSNGRFDPLNSITREQMAVMMFRYANYLGLDTSQRASYAHYQDAANVQDFAEEAMSWAVATGLISGKYDQTLLDPQGSTSRAECATIMTRFLNLYS